MQGTCDEGNGGLGDRLFPLIVVEREHIRGGGS